MQRTEQQKRYLGKYGDLLVQIVFATNEENKKTADAGQTLASEPAATAKATDRKSQK